MKKTSSPQVIIERARALCDKRHKKGSPQALACRAGVEAMAAAFRQELADYGVPADVLKRARKPVRIKREK